MTAEDSSDWRTVAAALAAGVDVSRADLKVAVKASLSRLQELAPGRSVEVRIPPFAAVQVIEGTTHRRGTPSAVVETDARTWLLLAAGSQTWTEATVHGRIRASGERSDLSAYLPLLPPLV